MPDSGIPVLLFGLGLIMPFSWTERTQLFCKRRFSAIWQKFNVPPRSRKLKLMSNRLSPSQVWIDGFIFVAAMWLISRLIIVAVMLLLAPSLPAPPRGIEPTVGWGVFSWWDSILYQQIAISGYEYANDGKEHVIAFFPLFPLIIRGAMILGLPVEVAGILVNNLAFLGALILLYGWVEERHGRSPARWATAAMVWCPLSLFGTVIYSEGLYLLVSTAALRAFDKQQYAWATLWGAMATATRPNGVMLVPAFLIVAWKRKEVMAYAAGLFAGVGLLLFGVYCQIRFGDCWAFLHAQQSWRTSLGFSWRGWWIMLMRISAGTTNWHHALRNPLHPALFLLIVGCGYLLFRFRAQLGTVIVYGFAFLGLCLWLVAGDPLIHIVMLFGGGYLVWRFRAQLSPVAVTYGFCGLGLILISGDPLSVDRLAYDIVSPAIAFGILLKRYPRCGYATMSLFALILACFALRFAEHRWIA